MLLEGSNARGPIRKKAAQPSLSISQLEIDAVDKWNGNGPVESPILHMEQLGRPSLKSPLDQIKHVQSNERAILRIIRRYKFS